MKLITLPNPVIMIFGGLAAFWVADIIHPGFNPIGVMILFLIPVLIVEFLYPKQDLKEQFDALLLAENAESLTEEPVSGELMEEPEDNENKEDKAL